VATTVEAEMSEPRGRSARWSAAALAAPVAAGLFAGTTAWASGHDPLHPGGVAHPAAPTVAAVPKEDPALVAMRRAVTANAQAVARLARQVAAVKAQAAALAASAGTGKAATGSSRGYSGSSSYRSAGTSHSSGGGGSTTVVVTVPAPKPPPVQVTTGASGAPK
jgi:uncharacterized membrane protein YgcG